MSERMMKEQLNLKEIKTYSRTRKICRNVGKVMEKVSTDLSHIDQGVKKEGHDIVLNHEFKLRK